MKKDPRTMSKNKLKIELLGTSFFISSDESVEYLSKIIEYLTTKIEEVKQSMPFADPLKISLITSLNLVDEMIKKGNDNLGFGNEREEKELEEIAKRLIVKIDESLSENVIP